jgi:hypothetical protein
MIFREGVSRVTSELIVSENYSIVKTGLRENDLRVTSEMNACENDPHIT